jgi:RNA polymerase sigma-70 factor (ECF subfamily)
MNAGSTRRSPAQHVPLDTKPQPVPGSANMTCEPPDETLVERIAEHDIAALDLLYTRYGRTAYSVAYSVLGDAEAAEDAVQDAFLTIWRRAETYISSRGCARTWLLTVVRHRAIDIARGRAARPHGVALEEVVALVAGDPDPSTEALRRIEAVSVRTAISTLPPAQRQVVELAFFIGLSYPEIADRMALPLGTVKSRIRLALDRLRTALPNLAPAM